MEDFHRVLAWAKPGTASLEGQIRVGEVVKCDVGHCFHYVSNTSGRLADSVGRACDS